MNVLFANTPLDRESVSQGKLDITRRVRTNPFPWNGQFSPQLVEELLNAYAPCEGAVLDPFVGSGTVLVEAARSGFPACGSEINPAAIILARVYQMVTLDQDERDALIDEFQERMFDAIGDFSGPLFRKGNTMSEDCSELQAALVELWRELSPGMARDVAAALVVLCDFHRKDLTGDRICKNWINLRDIIRGLPHATQSVVVHHADARQLPVETDSIDFVLTSPPYINVHNYHQNFRRSVEALQWDVLNIARSEIGSNRQNRSNRFLTVAQYSLDMMLAMREMARVARSGTRMILVLGRESTVRGTRFYNGELVAELAAQGAGMELVMRQERVFCNRFGTDIYEDILHFRAGDNVPDEACSLDIARQVAGSVLSDAVSIVPEKERAGLEDVLNGLDAVSPSPKLNPVTIPVLADRPTPSPKNMPQSGFDARGALCMAG